MVMGPPNHVARYVSLYRDARNLIWVTFRTAKPTEQKQRGTLANNAPPIASGGVETLMR